MFEGLEAETLRMEWPDHEEIVLPLVEGTFPEWCKVQNEHRSEATGSSSFTSLTLGSLAKLCEIYKGYTIDWKLGGDLGVIDWKLGPLWGQLMQARAQEPEPKNDDELTEPR